MSKLEKNKIFYGKSYVLGADEEAKKTEEAKDVALSIIQAAKYEAEKLLQEARVQTQEIIEKAKTEAQTHVDSIRQSAHAEGLTIGHDEGYQKIVDELKEKITSVDHFTKVDFDLKKKIIKSAHKDIVGLIELIAKKVLSNAIVLNKNVLEAITTEAINYLPEKDSVTIIINPELAEKFYEISPILKEKIFSLENVKIIEDNSTTPDGPIVESVNCRVDARISSQIDEIIGQLSNKLLAIPEDDLVKYSEEDMN